MKNGENLMINKKWYLVIVAIILVLGGAFFAVSKGGADSMDGKYYLYYEDSNTCSDDTIMTIHGKDVSLPSSSDDSTISLKLDEKNHRLEGSASMPYTYKDGFFSFSGVQYVKENSKAYKDLEK